MAIIRAIGWLATVAATFAVWTSRRPPADPFEGLVVVRDLVHGEVDGRPLRLDLLLPPDAGAGPRPLLLAVHGGSWIGGSRREYASQFADLARGGVAVAVVDYRLSRPDAPGWPGAARDVRGTLDRLLARADEYRLDLRRVAALGTSAGGLLAARVAREDSRIAAIVTLSVPFDLAELAAFRRLRHEPVNVFLGATPGADPTRAADASPFSRVTTDHPPALLIHGNEDSWVPLDQARKMHDRLEAVGVASRLLVIPGARHGFELQVGGPEPRDLTPVVRAFLDEAWRGGRGAD